MKKFSNLFVVLILSIFVVSCASNNSRSVESSNTSVKKVTVACTPVPHAEIMNEIKDMMRERGFELIVKEFSDYVTPNLAVDQGEVDANYFQHQPYLDDFNAERGTKIKKVMAVHYEPFGIYGGTIKTLAVNDGDKIAVPNDVTNEARALNLLQEAGLIKLKEGVGLKATKLDIIENEKKLEIVELESAQIPRSLDSVALACMNGNYAMEAGYKASDSIFLEPSTSEAAKTYANVVCVKEGNENFDYVKALIECLNSDKVKSFIDGKYEKSVIYME